METFMTIIIIKHRLVTKKTSRIEIKMNKIQRIIIIGLSFLFPMENSIKNTKNLMIEGGRKGKYVYVVYGA